MSRVEYYNHLISIGLSEVEARRSLLNVKRFNGIKDILTFENSIVHT